MFAGLRRKMDVLFLSFFALVIISVAASYWTLQTQNRDALVVNLAGRQRMLIQQMTKDAMQITEPGHEQHTHGVAVKEAAVTFDQTLRALMKGGQAPYLPNHSVSVPPPPPEILSALHQVDQTWSAFNNVLNTMMTAEPGSAEFAGAAQDMERLSPELVMQADAVVRLYETASTQKVIRLRWIQLLFFVGAVILLLVGFWATQKFVISPLRSMGKAAERIGDGDLTTPVTLAGPREIKLLAQNFDLMRSRLKASQDNLETRVAQRTHELTTAFELSQEIVTELDLKRLLSSVTNRAQSLMQADASALCLLEPDGENLILKASGGQTAVQPGALQSVGRKLPAQVIKQGRTVSTETACTNCHFLNAHAPGQSAATPLRSGDHTLGALCVVCSGRHEFDREKTKALKLLANSAATAITNAHLIKAEQHQTKQTAALAERENLAADLHDNLAQTLSFLNLKADRLDEILGDDPPPATETELEQMRDAINKAYGQVRAALVGLRDPVTVEDGLAKKLTAYVDDFRQMSNLPTDFTIVDSSALDLSNVAQKQAAHIVREALINVRRHAQAQQAYVRVERSTDGEQACFIVKDDGRGFDIGHVEGNGHLGLTIMQARAERCGGSLEINAAPGTGTTVTARFPQKKTQETAP